MKSRLLELLKRTFRGWMDDRAPRMTVAITAVIVPALLVLRNQRSRDRGHAPVMIAVAMQPPKPVLGSLLLGSLGVLARNIARALIKSAIIPLALTFLAKKRPEAAILPNPL